MALVHPCCLTKYHILEAGSNRNLFSYNSEVQMSMTKDPENPAPRKSSLFGLETVPSSHGIPWSICMGKRRDLSSSESLLPECYGLNIVFSLATHAEI